MSEFEKEYPDYNESKNTDYLNGLDIGRRQGWLAALKWVIQIAQENPDTVPERLVEEVDALGGFDD